MGAAETIVMDDHWRIIEEVKALTNGAFADVVIECTGAPTVVLDVMCKAGPTGIVCLAGVSSGGRQT